MSLIKLVFNTIWFWQIKRFNKTNSIRQSLRDKAFKIATNPKYDGYQQGLALMVYKFFDKKSSGRGVDAEPNYQLANELHKQVIKNSREEKFIHPLEAIFGVLI